MGLYIFIHIFCKFKKDCPNLDFVLSLWFNANLYIYVCLCFVVSFCFITQFLYICLLAICLLLDYYKILQLVQDCVCLNFVFFCFNEKKFTFVCFKIQNSTNLCMFKVCFLLLYYKFSHFCDIFQVFVELIWFQCFLK